MVLLVSTLTIPLDARAARPAAKRAKVGVSKGVLGSVSADGFDITGVQWGRSSGLNITVSTLKDTRIEATPLAVLANGSTLVKEIFEDPAMRAQFIALLFEAENARREVTKQVREPPKHKPMEASDLTNNLKRMRKGKAQLEEQSAALEEEIAGMEKQLQSKTDAHKHSAATRSTRSASNT